MPKRLNGGFQMKFNKMPETTLEAFLCTDTDKKKLQCGYNDLVDIGEEGIPTKSLKSHERVLFYDVNDVKPKNALAVYMPNEKNIYKIEYDKNGKNPHIKNKFALGSILGPVETEEYVEGTETDSVVETKLGNKVGVNGLMKDRRYELITKGEICQLKPEAKGNSISDYDCRTTDNTVDKPYTLGEYKGERIVLIEGETNIDMLEFESNIFLKKNEYGLLFKFLGAENGGRGRKRKTRRKRKSRKTKRQRRTR